MREVIVFPDVTQAACTYLGSWLGVATGTKVPNPRPDEFVLCRRVGGTRGSLVTDAATIAVEVWSDSDGRAHDLAQQARALLLAAPGERPAGVLVVKVDEVAGPQDFPDPLSDQPRYTFTVAVHVRGDDGLGS